MANGSSNLSLGSADTNKSASSSSSSGQVYETIFFTCFYVLISVIATFGNLLVLVAFYKNHSLQTTSNYLLANLALADSLQGCLSVPLRIAELLSTGHVNRLCQVSIPLTLIFGNTSNINILFVSLERFIAIMFPYFYYDILTVNKTLASIGIGWACTLLLGLLPSIGWGGLVPDTGQHFCRFTAFLTQDYITVLFIIVHLIPISTVVCVYGIILRASLRHSKRIHIQQKSVRQSSMSATAENTMAEDTRASTSERSTVARESIKQQKAARMVSIIVGLFIVLIVPIVLIDLIEMVGGPRAPLPLIQVTVCMIYANHCVNVFVYAGCNREYRKAFKKITQNLIASLKGVYCYK